MALKALALLVVITSPVASHAIASAAYRQGVLVDLHHNDRVRPGAVALTDPS